MKPQPKPQTREEIAETQRGLLLSLAREALTAAGGSKSGAVEHLALCLESDPALLRSVITATIDEVADQYVRRDIRNERHDIIAKANRIIARNDVVQPFVQKAKGPVSTPKISVATLAKAETSSLLEMRLNTGKTLGKSTRDEVEKFGNFQGVQGAYMVRQSRFAQAIKDQLPHRNSLVEQFLNESEVLRLWSEAA